MKGALSIIISFIFFWQSQAQKSIYTSTNFLLDIEEASKQFVFYNKEKSLELTVSGTYLIKKDSLILSTHKVDGKAAIFAIYTLSENYLINVYKQKAFYKSVPNYFYLLKKYYENGSIQIENYWNNFETGQYKQFNFNSKKGFVSVIGFNNFKLDGKQLYFFEENDKIIEKELHFKNGKLHGKSFFYGKLKESMERVELIKIEKYKNGILKKSKKPVRTLTFYIIHF